MLKRRNIKATRIFAFRHDKIFEIRKLYCETWSKLAMNEHHSNNRKIDPLKSFLLDDNTPNDKNRVEIGPTLLARREWEIAGLELPDLQAMRKFRWKRLTKHLSLIHI